MWSVAEAKGTTKAGAVHGSVKHMDRKVSLQEKFSKCKIDEFDTIDRRDVEECPAYFYMTPWSPVDSSHVETLCYIAGAMTKAANDKIQQKRTTDTLRDS